MSFESVSYGITSGFNQTGVSFQPGADIHPLFLKTPTLTYLIEQDESTSRPARLVIAEFKDKGFSDAARALSKKYQAFLPTKKFTKADRAIFLSLDPSHELRKAILDSLRKATHQNGEKKLQLIYDRIFLKSTLPSFENDSFVKDIASVVQIAADIVHSDSPSKSIRKFGGAAYELHLWEVILILAEKNPLQLDQKKLSQLLLIAALHDAVEDAPKSVDEAFLKKTLEPIVWLTDQEKSQIINSVQSLTVHTTGLSSQEKNQIKTDKFRSLCSAAANTSNPNQETDLFSLVVKIADTVANSRHASSEYRATKSIELTNLFEGYANRIDSMLEAVNRLYTFKIVDLESRSHLFGLISDLKTFLDPVVHPEARKKQIVFSPPRLVHLTQPNQ